MLEIIAIIGFTKRIGLLAERKGLNKSTWKVYMVLAWFISEIIGLMLGIITFGADNVVLSLILAYALAICSYFLLKSFLDKKPDAEQDNFDFEQKA
jgi:uncharacterized transporter YbjL